MMKMLMLRHWMSGQPRLDISARFFNNVLNDDDANPSDEPVFLTT